MLNQQFGKVWRSAEYDCPGVKPVHTIIVYRKSLLSYDMIQIPLKL